MVDKRQPKRHLPLSPKKDPNDRPHYPLNEVVALIDDDKVDIWPGALQTAKNDFGWESEDILKAIEKLTETDFYKRDVSPKNGLLVMDFYKARVFGENIYTHFYIDDNAGQLVIQSFKEQ